MPPTCRRRAILSVRLQVGTEMKHAFRDLFVSREHFYSIGIDEATGRHFLAIPVSNARVDYEERYEIDKAEFDRFMSDPEAALEFAERCRERKADDALIYQPSKERGEPYRPKAPQ